MKIGRRGPRQQRGTQNEIVFLQKSIDITAPYGNAALREQKVPFVLERRRADELDIAAATR